MVATHGHRLEKRDQIDKFSTAYETARMKAKADEKNKKEYEKWLEVSSRSVKQHAGKND